ncbi:unnamed protein product [Linum trigynum]|uniref:Uncharacterized protein n=1 Tax=Linum trigynum TaxID=586398 RepID=A0AAV2DEH8_9ROSI
MAYFGARGEIQKLVFQVNQDASSTLGKLPDLAKCGAVFERYFELQLEEFGEESKQEDCITQKCAFPTTTSWNWLKKRKRGSLRRALPKIFRRPGCYLWKNPESES